MTEGGVSTAQPIRPGLPDLAGLSLAEVAALAAAHRLPPVEQWDPPHCGHSDMRIAADGTWFHGGTPIGRPAMVKLFSSVLRREADGRHVLVTPVEKLDIDVDEAAFLAVEVTSKGQARARQLAFRLQTDELVLAGPANPLRFEVAADGAPRPYLHVRGTVGCGLEAKLARPVFYELAEMALAEAGAGQPAGLWSGGVFFAFPD
jgi:hypothetical protein